ncbi:hypothetical protein PspLS_03211 [Pyricularia sp. CBS 133598]|nr:hypothetical protein PspLS_03211 [Pyricularia sp. CBS 133598]
MSSTAATQTPQLIMDLLLQLMTTDELVGVAAQFKNIWIPNKQLLWTGLHREAAQNFANKHGLQTLTTAMGPLMDKNDPRCLYANKSNTAWSEYIKGASALFAYYISKGNTVVVLSPPPPDRFHPSGCTNFQLIEKPILEGKFGNKAVGRIIISHPTVQGAEELGYQLWPNDTAAIRAAKQAWKWERARTETVEEKLARQEAHIHKVRKDRAQKARRDRVRKAARQRALEQNLSSQHSEPWSLAKIFAERGLTQQDLDDIGVLEVHDNFIVLSLSKKQVLWNGVQGFRRVVQEWADKNGLQTLTTVMGSLLDQSNPSYGKNGGNKRSNYMKGASALFAWYISKGDKVIVLSLPPDENGDRFNPSPYTNYSGIEEPIVKGQLGNRAVGEMLILHPTIPEAEKFFYPLWPTDGQKAMKAILDTKGRGIWNWRTPSLSKEAQAHLDSILPRASSNADKCVMSGVAINVEQGGKRDSIQTAPKARPSTPNTNNQKPIQQEIVKGPATPSDCTQLEQKILAEGDIVLWLGNRNKIKGLCAALRLVLAADEIGLQRAQSKLEVLLEEVSSLQKEKIREKAAAKGKSEGSPKATVETESPTKRLDRVDCTESRQPAPDVTTALSNAIAKAEKAEREKEKKRRKKEKKKRKKEKKRREKEEEKRKKEEKSRKKEEKRREKEEERKIKEDMREQNEGEKTTEDGTVTISVAEMKMEKRSPESRTSCACTSSARKSSRPPRRMMPTFLERPELPVKRWLLLSRTERFVMDKAPHLVMHLGMTGWFHIRGARTAYTNYYKKQNAAEADQWPPKYWRFHLEAQDGTEAAFTDPRRFGRVRLVHCPGATIRKHTPLVENGPDPVVDADVFTTTYLLTKMRSRRVPVKALLLDQAVISGVGNWVADEVLFQARLHPEQLSHEFSDEQVARLHGAIRDVCGLACDKLADSDLFPDDWLFNHRWGKGAASRTGEQARLPGGERLAFLTVGGRTSCYAPELQKKTGSVPSGIKEEPLVLDVEKKAGKSKKADGGKKPNTTQIKVEGGVGGGQEEEYETTTPKPKARKRKQDLDGSGDGVPNKAIKKSASKVEAGAVEAGQPLRADPAIDDGRRRSGRLRAKTTG